MDNVKPVKLEDAENLIQKAVEEGTLITPEQVTPPEVTGEQLVAKTLDDCAKLLDLYIPQFMGGIKSLSNNKLKRLLKNLVIYPLNEQDYKPKDEEGTLFLIGSRILEAKHTLITYTMLSKGIERSNKEEATAEVVAPTEQVGKS